MSYRADKLVIDARTDTHRQTEAGNENTRRPKLASGNKNGRHFEITMIWCWVGNNTLSKQMMTLPNDAYSGVPNCRTFLNKKIHDIFCRKNNIRTSFYLHYCYCNTLKTTGHCFHCLNCQTCLTIKDTSHQSKSLPKIATQTNSITHAYIKYQYS